MKICLQCNWPCHPTFDKSNMAKHTYTAYSYSVQCAQCIGASAAALGCNGSNNINTQQQQSTVSNSKRQQQSRRTRCVSASQRHNVAHVACCMSHYGVPFQYEYGPAIVPIRKYQLLADCCTAHTLRGKHKRNARRAWARPPAARSCSCSVQRAAWNGERRRTELEIGECVWKTRTHRLCLLPFPSSYGVRRTVRYDWYALRAPPFHSFCIFGLEGAQHSTARRNAVARIVVPHTLSASDARISWPRDTDGYGYYSEREFVAQKQEKKSFLYSRYIGVSGAQSFLICTSVRRFFLFILVECAEKGKRSKI